MDEVARVSLTEISGGFSGKLARRRSVPGVSK
jgi:hypothetical protein